MENKRRKINSHGGIYESTEETARGPYRKEIFCEFVKWSVLTKEEKRGCGIPSAKVFSAKHGVHESQLSRWAKRQEFNPLRFEQMRKQWFEFLPDAFAALRKRIQRFGMSRDVELWLAYTEGWNRKNAAQQIPPATFTQDDIRTLLEYLPKNEQLEFKRTIAKLLLKARGAQEKELLKRQKN